MKGWGLWEVTVEMVAAPGKHGSRGAGGWYQQHSILFKFVFLVIAFSNLIHSKNYSSLIQS